MYQRLRLCSVNKRRCGVSVSSPWSRLRGCHQLIFFFVFFFFHFTFVSSPHKILLRKKKRALEIFVFRQKDTPKAKTFFSLFFFFFLARAMLRRTALGRTSIRNISNSLMYSLKKRDPSEGTFEKSSASTRHSGRSIQWLFLAVLVIGSTCYEQYQNPASVKIPVQDGRSLVT
jgi:hypothetical protein